MDFVPAPDLPLVQLRGVLKRFGGVTALNGVSLDIRRGEVLALVGENGAGKSTLNRILAGVLRPDAGEVLLEGRPTSYGGVPAAEEAGIAMVHQESIAFLDLDAADNFYLMQEPARLGGLWLDAGAMREGVREALSRLGETFPVDVPIETLTLAQRQMLAIARAVSRKCRLLILDEPTASLSARETETLFRVVRQLKEDGVAILYVSHRLEEVFDLADRVTVLRDGRHVATHPIGEVTRQDLIELMVGRPEADAASSAKLAIPFGEPLLRVEGLSRPGAFAEISFELRAGEIVALAGLVGAGRTEVARAIFGLDPAAEGRVVLDGAPVSGGPGDAIRRGIAYLPEDRQHEGLFLPLTVRENFSSAALRSYATVGWICRTSEKAAAEIGVDRLAVRTPTIEAPVDSLSGGNQQKVLFGKWLATYPRVLILDEPTRGVDVGAKAEIHRIIRELAKEGVAVLLISSELPEVLSLADRTLVMRQGRIAGELSRAEAGESQILALALPQENTIPQESAAPRKPLPREAGVLLLLAAMLVAAAIVNPAFLAWDNLRDMLVKVAPATIVACGLTFVILAREIDISVGSLMGLCAATLGIAGSADRLGWPAAAGVALCLGVGAAGGLANGLLAAYGKVPSIIVTLGTLTLYYGVTERLLGGNWIQNLPSGLRDFGTGAAGPVPYSVLVAGLVAVLAIWLSRRTAFGRRVYALGSNPDAAPAVGLPANRIKLAVFTLTGLLCGVAALFGATQLQVIESGFGRGFELLVVAAVVVGGTSIRGGRGSVIGSVIGSLTLGIVGTFLIFLQLGESATYWERAIQGGLILMAVLGEHLWRRRRGA